MRRNDHGAGEGARTVIAAQLEDLLREPRETLDLEIKAWIDLKDEELRAKLGKGLIALTNHGGGHLVIGFKEESGAWKAAEPHPADLSGFSQDLINSAVARYAEPVFHCETFQVRHPASGLLYPVTRVAAGTVPVMTKRSCPCGECVKANVYYIRRAGPKSEAPQNAAEWDALITRCVRTKRDDLLSAFRGILEPGGTTARAAITEKDALRDFGKKGRKRFEELVAKNLSAEKPSRYQHGIWAVVYRLAKPQRSVSLDELRRIVQAVELKHTGWPEWVTISREPLYPYPFEGLIECFMAETGERESDVAHSDFWRVSPDGEAYLLRGYIEDADPMGRVKPGTLFSVTNPVWRVGEAVLHAARLAKELEAKGPFTMRFEWEGLEGRSLTCFEPGRDMRAGWICRQPSVVSEAEVDPGRVDDFLPEIVAGLTKKLYEAFSFFVPPATMVAEELDKMKKNRF